MGLTQPSSNYVSQVSSVKRKSFTRDDGEVSPYIAMQILEGSGTGGANDTKGYHYFVFEMFKWTRRGSQRESKQMSYEEALRMYDSCKDFKSSERVLKSLAARGA